MSDSVPFDWIARCGRHYAYHRGVANRIVHCALIPVELAGALAIFRALVRLFQLRISIQFTLQAIVL